MKKKILSTIMLITILILSVFIRLNVNNKTNSVNENDEKVEKMSDNINNTNESVNIEEEKEPETQEIVENVDSQNDGVSKSEPTPSASNKTSQSTKTTSSKKTESKNTTNQKQEVKTETKVETKTSEEKKEQISSTPTPSPKEEPKTTVEEKKEEPSKTVEKIYEVPDSNTYKNDPAFIKLQKELFKTFKECNDAGEKEWRKDKANVSNIYCEAEYYKGAEAGIRLYIVYNDKTWKKYSR